MRINDIYNNSALQPSSRYGTGAADAVSAATEAAGGSRHSGLKSGDIIEGIVSGISRDTTIVTFQNQSFQNGEHEISFSKDSIDKAFVGQKRAFEVVENTPDKLVLRDLGGIASEIDARSIQRTNVDASLVTMANDFAETNGGLEKEDDGPIERLTDEDYSELRNEGFSIEDFKSERLSKAIERIKANRAAKKESIDEQSKELKATTEENKKRAAAAVSAKYASYQAIIDKLYATDMPITDANIAAVAGAIELSGAVSGMTDNSFAYLIKNELPPTIKNVYTSVYSGMIRKNPLDDEAFSQLEEPAQVIVDEANKALLKEEMIIAAKAAPAPATVEDARWMLEYEIPLNSDNLVYKKELEGLKSRAVTDDEAAQLAAEALADGMEADDAVLIASHRSEKPADTAPIGEKTALLRLQEIRLSMTTDLRAVSSLEQEIGRLKDEIKSFYDELARELGATENDAEAAVRTASAIESVANAPLEIYRATFSVRTTITLSELGNTGAGMIAASVQTSGSLTVRTLAGYEASQTEIRADLGDSILKAFRNADALVEQTGLEVNEANIKAVRILGYNSMEINADSIREMKFYDAKLTRMLDGMKPSVVLSMIRDGFNPLEHDIDSINKEIDNILGREGYSPEEKFSSFLVGLESRNEISESERQAYIGIYRLLYQIGKDDGAAIGSAIASGRALTLDNLLTEARTRRVSLDVSIDDNEAGSRSDYVNSISGQIMAGFNGTGQEAGGDAGAGSREQSEGQQPGVIPDAAQQEELEYNVALAKEAADVTEPEAWEEALTDDYENLTLEQVTLRLKNADKMYDGTTGTAEEIRAVMMASSGSRSFLRSLGVKDSKNNIESLDNDPAIPVGSKDELIDSLDSFEDMQSLFSDKARANEADSELELLGSIAILSRGRQIDEQLHSYDLLTEMAGRGHYRMNVETGDGTPARINLTVIHGTPNAGTVSIAVTASSYSLQADLSMTLYTPAAQTGADILEAAQGAIAGRITAQGGETEELETALNGFMTRMQAQGYDTSGIAFENGGILQERYFDELARTLLASSGERNTSQRGRSASTNQLYGIAKMFLANFI